jgi:hypothetical protein
MFGSLGMGTLLNKCSPFLNRVHPSPGLNSPFIALSNITFALFHPFHLFAVVCPYHTFLFLEVDLPHARSDLDFCHLHSPAGHTTLLILPVDPLARPGCAV